MSIESLWSPCFQQHIQNAITYFARMINGYDIASTSVRRACILLR